MVGHIAFGQTWSWDFPKLLLWYACHFTKEIHNSTGICPHVIGHGVLGWTSMDGMYSTKNLCTLFINEFFGVNFHTKLYFIPKLTLNFFCSSCKGKIINIYVKDEGMLLVLTSSKHKV